MHSFHDVKEQIRGSVDLVDLVSEHVSLRRAGRNLKGLCPFHSEKTPSFNVYPERQFFKCFGCNVGGDMFKFVQLRDNVEFREAVQILADRVGLDLHPVRRTSPDAPAVGRADLARANDWAARWFRAQLLSEAGSGARAYLERRHILPETTRRFEIGYAPVGGCLAAGARTAGLDPALVRAADLVRTGERGDTYDTFRDRLMFPIRDSGGRCIGFGGRTLGDSPAKYLNTSRTALFDKGRSLFGLPVARTALTEQRRVILVEGYTDCIACHQHGFSNTVATLGTAATDAHMRTLRRYVDTVILLFDSDAAGQTAAERAVAVALQQDLTVLLAQVPGSKDPAEFLEGAGATEFGELLNSAVDALGFLWTRTSARYAGASGASGRRQTVTDFVDLVASLSRYGAVNAIQRGVIIDQVARLLALPAEEVAGLFGRASRRRRAPLGGADESDAPRRPSERSADAEQSALEHMLEILVCEPGLVAGVADVFAAERLDDPLLRQVASVFLDLIEREGEVESADLMAALESPAEGQWVADAVVRGLHRGNFATTLADLKQRLHRLAVVRQGREASRQVCRRRAEELNRLPEDELDASLAAVQEGYSRHHHFASAGQAFAGKPIGEAARSEPTVDRMEE